jgi:hypothetical protein
MILEEVQEHPERTDLFLNKIITPHYAVMERDKKKVKKILLKILRKELPD